VEEHHKKRFSPKLDNLKTTILVNVLNHQLRETIDMVLAH
jgi:hypothetical protein